MIKAPDVTLLYVVLAFVVAYAILKKFLFGPLAAILEARQSEEQTSATNYLRRRTVKKEAACVGGGLGRLVPR